MRSSRVELFAAIRRDARREELSIRALVDRHGVHRRTVRAALASALPPPRKPRTAQAPKLDPVKPLIDEMLTADLYAPRKQRHTARRIHGRLVDEHGVDGLTYSTVRDYVRRRRPEIAAANGKSTAQAFVPQTHLPGAEAEVDFGDVWVDLAGEMTKCFLFTFRLSYSGRAVHRVFASQGQEAFIEGHVHAFTMVGGVPTDKIRYDNLKSAVKRVLFGRNRTESDHWIVFRSTYGFDAFYCMPGIDGAHEKGGVEGEVGWFRRNHLTPVPVVDSLDELNARIDAADAADLARRIEDRRPERDGQHLQAPDEVWADVRDRVAVAQRDARAELARSIGEQPVIGEHREPRADVVLRERETDVGADPGGLAGSHDDDGLLGGHGLGTFRITAREGHSELFAADEAARSTAVIVRE